MEQLNDQGSKYLKAILTTINSGLFRIFVHLKISLNKKILQDLNFGFFEFSQYFFIFSSELISLPRKFLLLIETIIDPISILLDVFTAANRLQLCKWLHLKQYWFFFYRAFHLLNDFQNKFTIHFGNKSFFFSKYRDSWTSIVLIQIIPFKWILSEREVFGGMCVNWRYSSVYRSVQDFNAKLRLIRINAVNSLFLLIETIVDPISIQLMYLIVFVFWSFREIEKNSVLGCTAARELLFINVNTIYNLRSLNMPLNSERKRLHWRVANRIVSPFIARFSFIFKIISFCIVCNVWTLQCCKCNHF